MAPTAPTAFPTAAPTKAPTTPTAYPTASPTAYPTAAPTKAPTFHYKLGSFAANVGTDAIFDACPAGYKPAELRDLEARSAITAFLGGLNVDRGTMFLG
jgi:hypothetical protein